MVRPTRHAPSPESRRAARATGYSGTPLAKKLGIQDGSVVYVAATPTDYREILAPLPTGVIFSSKPDASTDIAHVFATRRANLERLLARLRRTLRADAAVWVSWPKKAAKLPTDITDKTIRAIALPMGFVDVKVCAVTEIWSGLKLVVRKELR
jgi:hypothetical protein